MSIRRRVTNPTHSPFKSPKAVAQNQFKAESDINLIVEKAKRGIPPTNVRQDPRFIDISEAPSDLTEAFARTEAAWDLFTQLPAKAREELNNDPRRLLEATPEFMIRHGLAKEVDPYQTLPQVPGGGQPPGGGTEPPQTPKASPKGSKAPKEPSVSDGSE